MWEDYRDQYRLRGKVLSLSRAIRELPDLRRYRLVLIDESHNLRNREGQALPGHPGVHPGEREPGASCCRPRPTTRPTSTCPASCASSSPKTRTSASGRSGCCATCGETEFIRRHQCSPRSLAAFEKSDYRRRLARADAPVPGAPHPQLHPGQLCADRSGQRPQVPDVSRTARAPTSPSACPRRCSFTIDDSDPDDQYARLYADAVVDTINALALPRYGLGNYVAPDPAQPADAGRSKQSARTCRAPASG